MSSETRPEDNTDARPPATAPAGDAAATAISVRNVSKHYLIFDRPEDRLKQMVVPKLERLVGRPPRRYFRDFAALNDVRFDVKRGETVGIIGRNGSGKSTILQIVCGTLQPTGGSVDVNGRIAALLELGAGFNPDFTGRENAYLNAAILGLSRAETDDRFDDIARFADIGDFIDQPVKTYSSGMYVRLAFAVAINVDPDILVVDEALAVGDEAFQRKCFARIEGIRDRGGTILLVTHSAQTIVQLCDRALLFDRGEMILEGLPKTVVNQYQRFLNLEGEEAAQVREVIKAMDGWAESGPVDDADTAPESAWTRENVGAGLKSKAVMRLSSGQRSVGSDSDQLSQLQGDENAYLDPSLSSETTVVYENQGANITSICLMTIARRKVNVLQARRKYLLYYEAQFTREARNVAFGFTISTPSGLGIGGAGTSLDGAQQIPHVRQGSVVSVTFEFECLFNPGVYFVTAGVSGVVGGDRKFLHRIVEAMPLKVIGSDDRIATGYLNLAPVPIFALETADVAAVQGTDE